jgi:hypothetical protein
VQINQVKKVFFFKQVNCPPPKRIKTFTGAAYLSSLLQVKDLTKTSNMYFLPMLGNYQ